MLKQMSTFTAKRWNLMFLSYVDYGLECKMYGQKRTHDDGNIFHLMHVVSQYDGPLTVLHTMMVDPNSTIKKPGGKDLCITRGEVLDVIQLTNNKKALCRNQFGKCMQIYHIFTWLCCFHAALQKVCYVIIFTKTQLFYINLSFALFYRWLCVQISSSSNVSESSI